MKSQNSIHALVKSLTAAEKRYFKLYAKRNSINRKSNYILLFNLIDRQKVFDEKELKKKLSHQQLKLSYAETKYQLQNNILKCLVAFHCDNNPEINRLAARSKIAVLLSKSLYSPAIELIERLKKQASESGNFELVLDLISCERDVAHSYFSYEQLSNKIIRWNDEYKHAIGQLANLNEYIHAFYAILNIFNRIGTTRSPEDKKEINKILSQSIFYDPKMAHSHWARFWYFQSYKLHAWLVRDYETLLEYCGHTLKLFEQRPILKTVQFVYYTQSLEHQARTLIHIHREAEASVALQNLTKVIQIRKKSLKLDEQVQWFMSRSETELWFHLVFGYFKDGEKLIEKLEQEVEKLNKTSGRKLEIPTPFAIAGIYFGNGNYKKAVQVLNKIIQSSATQTRVDIQSLARILLLFCVFELQDMEYLSSVWRSVYRFLETRKRLHKVEESIIKYMRRSINFKTRDQFLKMYVDMREEFSLLKKNPMEKIVFDYFDFEAWLSSKIENVSFETALRKNRTSSKASVRKGLSAHAILTP